MSVTAMEAFRAMTADEPDTFLTQLTDIAADAVNNPTFRMQIHGLIDSIRSIRMSVGYNLPPLEPPTLEEAKAAKWTEILALRQVALSVAPTTFGEFDSDVEGKANITGKAVELLTLGEEAPEIVRFKRHDNSVAELTPAEFKQMSLEVTSYLEGIYALSWQLEALIIAALTNVEVEAITWPVA